MVGSQFCSVSDLPPPVTEIYQEEIATGFCYPFFLWNLQDFEKTRSVPLPFLILNNYIQSKLAYWFLTTLYFRQAGFCFFNICLSLQ